MAVLSLAPLQFIASIPPVTRAFTAATVVSSLLYYWLAWTTEGEYSPPYLVLIPGTSFFYPYTFFTSAFVETTLIEVCARPRRNVFTTSDLTTVLVDCYAYLCSCISEIFGTTLGGDGDSEVHRCYNHRLQHHRVLRELVGVRDIGTPHLPVCIPKFLLLLCLNLSTLCSYGQQYHGQMALQTGILVAFTQIIPEHQVQMFGVIKARVKVC